MSVGKMDTVMLENEYQQTLNTLDVNDSLNEHGNERGSIADG